MRFTILFLLASLYLISFTAQSQTIIPAGYVSGTWDESGSPYLVQGDIIIHEDSSLNIARNVEVRFADSASLTVNGLISAIGDIGGNVLFNSSGFWNGIHIMEHQSTTDTCIFLWCYFVLARQSDTIPGGALYIENRDFVLVEHSRFSYVKAQEKGGAMYLLNSDILIQHSYFQYNSVLDTTSAQGGVIYMKDSDPILYDNEFSRNEAINGGAVYSLNSSPRIDECIFDFNISNGGGGALVFHQSGHPAISNCRFEDNTANGSGGAIAFLENIHAQVMNCSFERNESTAITYLADGGAVLITPYDNEISFINCEFTGNYAEDYGGALYATSPTKIIGCLFSYNLMSNMQDSRGGALYAGETGIQIINSTFSRNFSMTGSSIYGEDAEIALINSIVWDNVPWLEEPPIYLHTNVEPPVLFVDHSDIENGTNAVSGTGGYVLNWTEDNIDADPNFTIPGHDYALIMNSPCINAGRSDTLLLFLPNIDIAGNPRIVNGEIDMGCYEYQEPINVAELSEKQEFMVFPNPSREYINIKNTSGADFRGQVFLSDLSGRRVFEKTVNIQQYSSFRMSVSSLQGGMYILNLVSAKSRIARKLLVTGR